MQNQFWLLFFESKVRLRSWSCFHVYAISKQTDSRAVLPTKENLKILVKLCDSARIVNDEEGVENPGISYSDSYPDTRF